MCGWSEIESEYTVTDRLLIAWLRHWKQEVSSHKIEAVNVLPKYFQVSKKKTISWIFLFESEIIGMQSSELHKS